jgi:hypothetical protein
VTPRTSGGRLPNGLVCLPYFSALLLGGQKNPEYYRRYNRCYWRIKGEPHPETLSLRRKKYKERHPDAMNTSARKYRAMYRERVHASQHKHGLTHPERNHRSTAYFKAHPEKARVYWLRHASKRRGFGLNSPKVILGKLFRGSVLHHLTLATAIYIPARLHRSTQHNLIQGLNMDRINVAAMDFFEAPRGIH